MAKTTTAPPDPLYGIEEACARLRCSPPTIYRLNDAGEVTVFKVRGKSLVAGVEILIKRQVEAAELGRRGRQRQTEAPPDARLASPPGGGL